MIIPMIKAIQEQQVMIEALKKQNDTFQKQSESQKKINQELLKRLEIIEKK
jgi:hypothetical protein